MKKSFLMIGQSNMAGRGDFGQVLPIRNPNCTMLRCGLWREMADPCNPDQCIFEGTTKYRFHSGVSLMPSFADACQKYFDCEIGLIPAAYGGSKLAQWMPGEALFDHAVLQAKLAMRDSELVGIMWHQGESDSGTPEESGSYCERFTAMITELRRQLHAEDVPLVVGELGRFVPLYENGKYPYAPDVNAQIRKIAETVPRCAFVSSEGLGSRPDNLHFHSHALRELGLRYFEAYKTLL